MLSVNELIQHSNQGQNITERILWLDKENDVAITMNTSLAQALPVTKRLSEIIEGLQSEEIRKTLEDPWGRYIDESSLSEKEKSIRERGWKIIGPMITPDNEPFIYDSVLRGKMVRETMARCEVAKIVVYRLLKRYWQSPGRLCGRREAVQRKQWTESRYWTLVR